MLSSATCREQQKIQLSRAGATSLANVRTIAERAAKAWSDEALCAEKRENRHRIRLSMASDAAHNLDQQALEDRALSENPDRGYAAE